MTAADPNYDWLSELPLPPGTPDLRMGTRGIDEADWFIADHKTEEELVRRSRLLIEHPDHAQLLPGHEAALGELVALVETDLGSSLRMGPIVDGVRSELVNLAVTVPEDVLLMVRNDDHWALAGGVLLFPDQWKLMDKIGRSLAAIHAPTEGYDELLEAKVDQFFDRLKPGRMVSRRNWFVHDEPTYFLDGKINNRGLIDAAGAADLWIRSERQTLRRLNDSDAIVFTVKTQFAPLSQLRARAETAAQMVEFIQNASQRSLENKAVAGRVGAVLDYLSAD